MFAALMTLFLGSHLYALQGALPIQQAEVPPSWGWPYQSGLVEFPEVEVPPDDQVLLNKGEARFHKLDPNGGFNLLVWNIQKASNYRTPSEFFRLCVQTELCLIQESIFQDPMERVFGMLGLHEVRSAVSFYDFWGKGTGVTTASQIKSHETYFLRSPDREPILNTPKMIIVTKYQVEGYANGLLVVNMHGINFVGIEAYKRQINKLYSKIKSHRGPMIVAGDFNTFLPSRFGHLVGVMSRMGAKLVNYKNDPRLLKLDHVFVRGLKVKNSKVLSQVNTSDHYPLFLNLSFR